MHVYFSILQYIASTDSSLRPGQLHRDSVRICKSKSFHAIKKISISAYTNSWSQLDCRVFSGSWG